VEREDRHAIRPSPFGEAQPAAIGGSEKLSPLIVHAAHARTNGGAQRCYRQSRQPDDNLTTLQETLGRLVSLKNPTEYSHHMQRSPADLLRMHDVQWIGQCSNCHF
jgi:hypothetical protein